MRTPLRAPLDRWSDGAVVACALHVACSVQKESDAIRRKQTFLLIRYGLIFTTASLAFVEGGGDVSPAPMVGWVIVALASNFVLGQQSPFSFFDPWMQAPVLVADTVMISVALLLTRAGQESFLFFFFVLIMAAKVENLVLLGIGGVLLGFASMLAGGVVAAPEPLGEWASPSLMRVPFLLATSIFFGYVVLPERTGDMGGLGTAVKVRRPAPRREAEIPLPQ
jgi:hypothetical protein